MSEIAGLHWEAHGQPEAECVLLSAGLGGAGGYWAPNLPGLSANFRTLTYDHRGTGRSDRALDGRVTIDTMADDVLALMDGLSIDRICFVGHALGGLVGLALALRAPDRLIDLVVVNGWSRPDPHIARCMDTRLTLLRDAGPRAWVRAQPLFLYPPDWSSTHAAAIDAQEEEQLAAFQGADNVSKRVAALRTFDIDARLAEITMPVLLIAADDDMLVPPLCSARQAQGLPRAELRRMATGGHACNVTAPAAFDALVTGWFNRIKRS